MLETRKSTAPNGGNYTVVYYLHPKTNVKVYLTDDVGDYLPREPALSAQEFLRVCRTIDFELTSESYQEKAVNKFVSELVLAVCKKYPRGKKQTLKLIQDVLHANKPVGEPYVYGMFQKGTEPTRGFEVTPNTTYSQVLDLLKSGVISTEQAEWAVSLIQYYIKEGK